MARTATLFVILLMTNLAEYQYSMVLQDGRGEAELAALFGTLYAASNLFNLVICLFVFNRLATRLGVRNVAFIQPLTYFAVFGWFFLQGGTGAALAAFFRSEEHTSELQSLMRISYAVFCLKKKNKKHTT